MSADEDWTPPAELSSEWQPLRARWERADALAALAHIGSDVHDWRAELDALGLGGSERFPDLRGAPLRRVHPREFFSADLRGCNFSYADLSHCKATKSDFTGCDLSHANLAYLSGAETDFSDAKLIGAYLYGAHLRDASFEAADLTHATLDKADLTYADFEDGTLAGASLRDARLRLMSLSDVELSSYNVAAATDGVRPLEYDALVWEAFIDLTTLEWEDVRTAVVGAANAALTAFDGFADATIATVNIARVLKSGELEEWAWDTPVKLVDGRLDRASIKGTSHTVIDLLDVECGLTYGDGSRSPWGLGVRVSPQEDFATVGVHVHVGGWDEHPDERARLYDAITAWGDATGLEPELEDG